MYLLFNIGLGNRQKSHKTSILMPLWLKYLTFLLTFWFTRWFNPLHTLQFKFLHQSCLMFNCFS